MVFQKGHKINIGRKFSKEHKHKLSLSRIGKIFSEEHKQNIVRARQGYRHSIETIEKIRKAHIGKHHSEETKKKIGNSQIGKTLSLEHKIKISQKLTGRKYHEELYPNFGLRGKHHTKETAKKISKNVSIAIQKCYDDKIYPLMGFQLGNVINKDKSLSLKTRKLIKEKRKLQNPVFTSSIELKIQNFLKLLNIEYFTHQYIHIKHGYQCDILIPSKNLVVECDGNYWHKYPIGNDLDHVRTKELLEKGFKVLRLWEFEIKQMDINVFKQKIMELKYGK